jgi:hypothetical protein
MSLPKKDKALSDTEQDFLERTRLHTKKRKEYKGRCKPNKVKQLEEKLAQVEDDFQSSNVIEAQLVEAREKEGVEELENFRKWLGRARFNKYVKKPVNDDDSEDDADDEDDEEVEKRAKKHLFFSCSLCGTYYKSWDTHQCKSRGVPYEHIVPNRHLERSEQDRLISDNNNIHGTLIKAKGGVTISDLSGFIDGFCLCGNELSKICSLFHQKCQRCRRNYRC